MASFVGALGAVVAVSVVVGCALAVFGVVAHGVWEVLS